MKLRGTWVTVNRITRFVRDPDPVKPKRIRRRKKDNGVLRAHDYVFPKPKAPKPLSPVFVPKIRKHPVKTGKPRKPSGPRMLRCVNPDCLCWFATMRKNGSACSPECQDTITTLNARMGSLGFSVHILHKHAELVSRRRIKSYDHPAPSPYALDLLCRRESACPVPGTCHFTMKGFTDQLEDSSFARFYYLGSSLAASYPGRPCTHSGIRGNIPC